MNVFILCAGRGSRFESICPKPLNLINGKPMIYHTISSLSLHKVVGCHLYVVYNRRLEQCNFREVVLNMFPAVRFHFILLDYFTRGASESAYMGLQQALQYHEDQKNGVPRERDTSAAGAVVRQYDEAAHKALLTNNLLFLDNDTIYPEEMWTYLNHHFATNFLFSNFNNHKEPIYSYIQVNKDNFVIDIKEKQKISDLICIGGYGFKNAAVFQQTFKYILSTNSKTNNEFYMSLVFAVLLHKHLQAVVSPSDGEESALTALHSPTNAQRSMNGHKEDSAQPPVQHIIVSSDVLNVTINKITSMGTPTQLIEDDSRIFVPLRYVFDLDNTLVTYPGINKDYSSVKPIPKMIALARKLKADGHTIIIYTARRMATHHYNVGAVIRDIGRVTMDTLDAFQIPYDELIFGKPLGDVYIDDRAYNAYDERLYHLLGEYQMIDDDIDNKLANNKYNSMRCINERIIKTVDRTIGAGELFFYESLESAPGLQLSPARRLFVKYFGYTISPANAIELRLQKVDGIPIAYLYINHTFSGKLLHKLLACIREIHSVELETDNRLPLEEYQRNYAHKLTTRFQNKQHYAFEGAEETYERIMAGLERYFQSGSMQGNIVQVVHGDPWFSNVLLSYRDEFKFIDMKGLVNGKETLSGDKLYDYAKVLQSLLGFDCVLYSKPVDPAYSNSFVQYFRSWLQQNEPDVDWEALRAVTACLVFGVFHAYADMSDDIKAGIVQLVKNCFKPDEAPKKTHARAE